MILPTPAFAADAERLRAIADIQRLLSSQGDERSLLQRICDVFSAHHLYALVGFCAAEPDGSVLPLAATDVAWSACFQERGPVRWDVANRSHAFGIPIRNGAPTTFPANDAGMRPWHEFAARRGVRSVAALPFDLTETVGLLVVGRDDEESFEPGELDLLQGVAEDIARALENVHMRTLLAAERDHARRRESRLKALWTLAVGGDYDLDAQAQAIISEGTRTLGFEWGAIGHVDGGTMLLDFVATDDPFSPRWYPLDTTLSSEAIATGRTFAHADLTRDPRFAMTAAVLENNLRAFTATPFAVSGRTYVLSFGASHSLDRNLDPEDLSYLDLLVSFFSRAIRQRDDAAKIRYLQSHDPLTGLPNRARFIERLDELVERTARTAGRFALLAVNADRFRLLVDRFGLQTGDELIAEIGRRVSSCMIEGHELFRNSGDSFSILVPKLQSPEQLDRLARSIVSTVAEPISAGNADATVSVSVGMAIYPDDGVTGHELTLAAAAALRRAKSEESEYRFFSTALDDQLSRRRRLSEDLQGAVERDELVLQYQPWIELDSQRVGGVEALVRWQHPRLGTIEPSDFVMLAEETAVIHSIGAWTLMQAAMLAAAFVEAKMPLSVAVNLSSRQFGDPNLSEYIDLAIAKSSVDPSLLELEVTESYAMRDPAGARRILSDLRERGVRIALDDFGTGHSSLAYLKHLPVDIIKIDQSFTRGLPSEASDAAIARAIIALASSINCEARAEGVETHDQALWLSAAGCRTAQGYWISRPLSPQLLMDWLRERASAMKKRMR